jgi:O-antigen ligase
MTETLRYRRGVSFSAIAHAALARMRSWRIGHVLRWSIAILLIGMLTGAMAVILPPMASIGVVALCGVLLLWALPELHVVPVNLLRKMFFIMVFVQLCVPNYYAIDTGVLPWISVRRLTAGLVILLFCITLAGSELARSKIADTLRSNRILSFLVFGLLAMLVLSIPTAHYKIRAFSGLIDTLLTWYVPLAACILIVRTHEDVISLLKVVAIAGIVDAALGSVEFYLERRFYFDIIPSGLLERMLEANPALQMMYSTPLFRNGLYRASSVYSVPLSFGELAAMTAPIGAYFFFHATNLKWRLLGTITVVASVVSLIISGARGGFIAFLVAMPAMLALWTIRYSKSNRGSLIGGIMGVLFSVGFLALLGMIAFSGRLSKMVIGGGDTVASTSARSIQFNLALPHILANPITGNGAGSSGELVGFYNPGSTIPTVDSYVITLLVEQGVPGLLLFFGTIAFGAWIATKIYISLMDERATVAAPIACSLIAFGVYRLVLSQGENHTLFFLIVGLVFAVSKLSREWTAAIPRNAKGFNSLPLHLPSHLSERPKRGW